ncbi:MULTISPECIES: SPOR domain-containing protein [Delftia]|jgi:cell division protein FtsN|uniref:SPOR domain-containing protein n=2 Tax=Delftia TaxID=80865 RepID=A0AAX3SLR4_9BURK|nr:MULTISPECIES: SPOR domain-containing protein [Delftia]KEH09010.1 sporulation protein [Delftia tsuruhatensis]MDH0851608.1 SPOR domain-containing protein [Delftia tsuruhatensis]MDR6728234.1 cell division protein FtsN [Delftia lacustris]WEL98703.1 SPOR domain-containing protein [Delftia tsuruhatensis]WFF81016.1 SPOR domain-containing protein [Delftia tsuruhatensis]
MKTQQRGGTVIGLIIGMIVGLAAALAVAVYVTKVPVPFLSKGGKTADQDAAEAQRNKNWDPNAPLQGKNPAPPPPAAVTPSLPGSTTPAAPTPPAVAGGVTPPPAPVDPAKPPAKPDTKTDGKTSADPLGDLVKARSAAAEKTEKAEKAEAAFNYFVQAGAFRSQGDADAQRAKLAMLGWEARVSEREQNGITIFRVRVGPFTKRDDAEQLKQKLDGAGVESTLVRAAR